MTLRQGLQVIIQGPDASVSVRCDGLSGVPSTNPSYIAVVPDGSPTAVAAARDLRYELIQRLAVMKGVTRAKDMPCGPLGRARGGYECHAFNEPTCRYVIILIGDPRKAYIRAPWPTARIDYIPLLPPGVSVPKLAPPLNVRNARNWVTTPIEFIPEVFAAAGITSSEARVFVSYRTDETTPLSNQLFDALNRAGFDVFVDRFRIAVGADFQQRILEELAHKGMVVFIESAGILASRWTRYEAAVAKSSRLGILALHVPGGVDIPDIDVSRRVDLMRGWNRRRGTLSKSKLEEVVARIRRDHAFYEMRRRQLLRDSMRRALQRAGVSSQTLLPSGAIEATENGRTYVLWLPPRPAELTDFHHVATAGGDAGATCAIFGPAAHMIGRAREMMRWLAATTNIRSFDESQIRRKAADIAAGSPL